MQAHKSEAPPKTILVVDDEATVRDSLQRALSAAGYTAIVAANRAEALTQIERNATDAVLLDWNVGMENGEDIARQLVRANPAVPIFFFTGRPDQVSTSASALAAAVLAKPLDLVVLTQTISIFLSSSGQHEAGRQPAGGRDLLPVAGSSGVSALNRFTPKE